MHAVPASVSPTCHARHALEAHSRQKLAEYNIHVKMKLWNIILRPTDSRAHAMSSTIGSARWPPIRWRKKKVHSAASVWIDSLGSDRTVAVIQDNLARARR